MNDWLIISNCKTRHRLLRFFFVSDSLNGELLAATDQQDGLSDGTYAVNGWISNPLSFSRNSVFMYNLHQATFECCSSNMNSILVYLYNIQDAACTQSSGSCSRNAEGFLHWLRGEHFALDPLILFCVAFKLICIACCCICSASLPKQVTAGPVIMGPARTTARAHVSPSRERNNW